MPSVGVKLYSVFFKFMLKNRLQNRIQSTTDESTAFGITSRPEETVVAANPSFTDGVATKDIHIDPFTSLTVRIFLPESALNPPDVDLKGLCQVRVKIGQNRNELNSGSDTHNRRYSVPGMVNKLDYNIGDANRRSSYGNEVTADGVVYKGYAPLKENCRKLPVMLQFHGGGFVSGSCDSVANDYFCRRIAKLCDVIVLSVGYRLAPESKYPAAFEDALKVLHWLGKQANLAECSKSMGNGRINGVDMKRADGRSRHIVDTFGASMVEPWLAAHGNPSR